MGITIEEFVSKIRWDTDNRGVESFQNSVDKVGKAVLAVSAAVVAGTTALLAFAGITARNEAVQINQARAVGMAADKMEALSSVFKALGFDFEKTIDLSEELNNKLGEYELTGMVSVKESLQLLKLEYKEIKDLAPEDQFIRILDAAKKLDDSQVAVSAVDMLMGGDANKMMGHLRTYEGSLEDIIKQKARLNFRTEESREATVRFADGLNKLGSVWTSVTAYGSGLIGKALSPLIDKTITYIAANKEIIQSKIDGFIGGLAKAVTALYRAFVFLAPKVSWFFGKIAEGVKAVGGFGAIVRIAGLLLAQMVASKVITGLIKIVQLVKAGRAAAMLFNAAWFLVPIVLALVAEDIYQFVKGNDSLIGEMIDGFKAHYDRWVYNTELVIGEIAKDLEGLGDEISAFYDEWENKNADTLGEWVSSIAGAFGVTEKEAQQFLLSLSENLANSFSKLAKGVGAVFEWWIGILFRVKDAALAIFGSIADQVASTFLRVIESVKAAFKKAVSFIRTLPGFGSFGSTFGLANSTGSTTGPRHSFPTPSTPAPSAAARSTSNNSEQTINVTNHVTQRAGESGEVFADRVTDGLNKAAASIQRNLGSGLAY